MDRTALLRELFTPHEYDAVRGHADDLGVSVIEYVRRTCLERALGWAHLAEADEARSLPLGKLSVPQVERARCVDGASSPAFERFLDTLAHPHPQSHDGG